MQSRKSNDKGRVLLMGNHAFSDATDVESGESLFTFTEIRNI